jgi:hypothetical protein
VTLALNPSAVATSAAGNVIFGFAGTAYTCCKLFLNIHLSVPCAVEDLVIEGLLGLWTINLGERMTNCVISIHSIQSPLNPVLLCNDLTPKKRGGILSG